MKFLSIGSHTYIIVLEIGVENIRASLLFRVKVYRKQVFEALSVNSGLSFRRAFGIVLASTQRLGCSRKYHD